MITSSITKDEYYKALVAKDVDYRHKFIAAVKTTGIFCVSTCYARKPKYQNVDFYPDITSAQSAGFRACKLCKPTNA